MSTFLVPKTLSNNAAEVHCKWSLSDCVKGRQKPSVAANITITKLRSTRSST